jgi:hypothetical protein
MISHEPATVQLKTPRFRWHKKHLSGMLGSMLATRIRQKDGVFYFASFKAPDILSRVRFTSRFYFEGEKIEADEAADDPIA